MAGRNKYDGLALSAEEIKAGGFKRHLGGGPLGWERRGAFQLAFLRWWLDLAPGARLLDIGCGPVRAGVHFMRYLAPGGYFGVDFNASFIEAARGIVVSEGLSACAPRLEVLPDFDFARLGGQHDVLLCFSVLNHCDPASRAAFFERVPAAMHADSRLVVTHAGWYRDSPVPTPGLVLSRAIDAEEALPAGLAFSRWGFDGVGDRLPILEFRRIG